MNGVARRRRSHYLSQDIVQILKRVQRSHMSKTPREYNYLRKKKTYSLTNKYFQTY